jgi:anti-sigma-K factor RskA
MSAEGLDDIDARLRELAREVTHEDTVLHDPPPEIWAAIEAELTLPHVTSLDAARLRRKERTRVPKLGLMAAAAAVVLVIGLVSTNRAGDPPGSEVASVEISNDGLQVALDGAGEATLIRQDSGDLALDLDLPDLPETDGVYEIWMIDGSINEMVSLGTASGDGTYAIPAGVDPSALPVVDVSVEPLDGDPTHSGQSILRGTLDV